MNEKEQIEAIAEILRRCKNKDSIEQAKELYKEGCIIKPKDSTLVENEKLLEIARDYEEMARFFSLSKRNDKN